MSTENCIYASYKSHFKTKKYAFLQFFPGKNVADMFINKGVHANDSRSLSFNDESECTHVNVDT